jgi:glycosyltransferase involved in cell wall biosynthesis
MKVAIIGTVGVPARYGGFETLAEQLARAIRPPNHELVLYCQRSAYPELRVAEPFAGHRRVLLPLRANGAASMVHDMLAMAHAAWVVRADTLLVLGYSGAWFLPFVRLLRPGALVVTNIDGMEWRREKFGRGARALLRCLEWFATRFSHRVIADNAALVALARDLHGVEPRLIAYGGDHTVVTPKPLLDLEPGYALSIARIEPENNCHLILAACARAGGRLVFVGNWAASAYGRELKQRYADCPRLQLVDPVYDVHMLATLRGGAGSYIHGHSVGGTNPSLVEALFHTDRILSFDCSFNRATLGGAGAFFRDEDELFALLALADAGRISESSLQALRERYQWSEIVRAYVETCRQ